MESSGYFEDITLCGASKYTKKYYLNDEFFNLPEDVKKELRVMCVLFTEDVGGTIRLYFDEEGGLNIETDAEDEDILYDEIGSVLCAKRLQREKRELFEALELYWQTKNLY